MQVDARVVNLFSDHNIIGEEVLIRDGAITHRQFLIPTWYSARFLEFMVELERRVQISILAEKNRGPTRTLRQFVAPPNSTIKTSNVPKELPIDCYHQANFLDCLLPVQLKAWKLKPPIIPEDVKDLFAPAGSIKKKSSPNAPIPTPNPPVSAPNAPDVRPAVSNPIIGPQDESEFPAGLFNNLDDEAMIDGENDDEEEL
ncbi:uncharacterized protein MELLADRAFT_72711 [Melampsora larici-populina 98AG31]|uniref:Uncharacterized protein n=1 Tax=Melampsora larici-populina (strain 98AG31 / pathotype 3-4-7) TaxID=747676 RepID=F4RXY4_MELLP|nr:uncharacterized protein MELLADRAFT_72711 [Melampsora larici-populina 98AG31]EGG02813.1 hypothetical protein MELLADRAFT_72711 [Melampsora larici-populina 98AG31]